MNNDLCNRKLDTQEMVLPSDRSHAFLLFFFLLKFSLVDFVRSIRPFAHPSMEYVNFCWFYFWFLDFLSAMLGIYFFMSADGLKSRLLRDMLPHEYDENKNIVRSLLWQLNHQSKLLTKFY